jgi:DNA-binding MarR family transcriptional regulator
VGELAERLQAQPHGVVALITRCEARGLVHRWSRGGSAPAQGRRALARQTSRAASG